MGAGGAGARIIGVNWRLYPRPCSWSCAELYSTRIRRVAPQRAARRLARRRKVGLLSIYTENLRENHDAVSAAPWCSAVQRRRRQL